MVATRGPLAMSEAIRIVGRPSPGGVLIIADHASNRVPADIDLGIDPVLLDEHIAIDIGVAAVAEAMVAADTQFAAALAHVSRLVCDFNREEDAPGVVPEVSDGHPIPGNRPATRIREQRLARFFRPYHAALEDSLADHPPALILSLHSFTPRLASDPAQQRPWHCGVLYNEDDRGARLALPLLEAEGLTVGDQQPYSGRLLNATMNRHAEAHGRLYLGVEVRQDQIDHPAGQALWAERLVRVSRGILAARSSQI